MGRKRQLTDEQRQENRRALERNRRASASLRSIIAAQTPKEAPGVAKPIGDMSHAEMSAAGIAVQVISPVPPAPTTVRPARIGYRGNGSVG